MRMELSTGVSLAVDLIGEQGERPLVLLHGLSSSRAGYAQLIGHLTSTRQLRIVNVDLRGHGESDRATLDTYDAPSYAADVAALIEHVVGGPVTLAGHSLGGVVALAVAQARPDLVRALLLEDPPLFEGDDARRAASPVASFFPLLVAAVRDLQARDAGLDEYEAMVRPTTPSDDVMERADALRHWDPAAMEAAITGVVWRGFDPVAPVTCPVTILRADPAMGAVFEPGDVAPFQEANAHAEIVMVPGATHGIHSSPTRAAYLEQFDRFLDAT